MKVKIDPEFAALIPITSTEADSELEQEIIQDGGFIEPLIVWGNHHNTLLDGHRRYKIHIRNPKLKMPSPVKLNFESRQEAHDWIIRHQLSKRNVTEAQRTYLIGKLYRDHKLPVGANQHGGSDKVADPKTARQVAESQGVSERTVHRAESFAEAVDAVAEIVPEAKTAVLSGEVKATTKDLEKLSELPKGKAKKAAKAIASGDVSSVKQAIQEVSGEERDGCSDLSPQEAMTQWNRLVESWAREMMAPFKNAPEGPWLDKSRLAIVEGQLKSAAASARQAKCDKICPLCDGVGCDRCHDTGFMPKRSYEMAGGK